MCADGEVTVSEGGRLMGLWRGCCCWGHQVAARESFAIVKGETKREVEVTSQDELWMHTSRQLDPAYRG